MEGRSYAVAVGVFVVIFAIALIVAALWLGQDRTRYASYTVISKQGVSGLQTEAPVKLQGVTVGRVKRIRFDPGQARTVLVDIEVAEGTPITSNTFAQLGFQGITGLSHIQLEEELHATAGQRLAAGGSIAMRPSLLDRVAAAGPELIDKVDVVIARLAELLDEPNRRAVGHTLVNLEQASQEIGSLARRAKPGAAAIEPLTKDAKATLAKANEALARIAALSDELKQKSKALDDVQRAAVQVDALGKDVRNAVPRLEPLVDELSRSSRNLTRLLAELNAHPQSVLLGKPPQRPGPGEPGFDARVERKP